MLDIVPANSLLRSYRSSDCEAKTCPKSDDDIYKTMHA